MSLLHRIATIAAVCVFAAPAAWAQYPPPNPYNPQTKKAAQYPPRVQPGTPATNAQVQTQNRTVYRPTQYQTQVAPVGYGAPQPQSSVLQHYPYYGSNENSYGFRNPGGVGKYEEYYPPGNTFQTGGHDPVTHAGFDQGLPVGSIQEQAMAYNAGTARYSAIQQHMDNFSRPLGGYGGFGFGFGPF